LELTDEDAGQYHRGKVFLEDIPDAQAEILWRGTEIINGVLHKIGVAFIPKERFVGEQKENVTVFIDVQDYKDPGCTVPAGGHLLQMTVSKEDLTLLMINVRPDWTVILQGSER
jgi:hypothetical protein